MFRTRRILVLLAALLALGAVFAFTEVQIEGAAGWAAGLPTWRIDRHPLLDLVWGGRPLTGYHLGIFLFMFLVFHLVFAFHGRFSRRLEARAIGALMVFWIVEDFLWFVMNPAFGLAKFNPAGVPWHRHWWLGVPSDYLIFVPIGCLLIAYSFRRAAPRAPAGAAGPEAVATRGGES